MVGAHFPAGAPDFLTNKINPVDITGRLVLSPRLCLIVLSITQYYYYALLISEWITNATNTRQLRRLNHHFHLAPKTFHYSQLRRLLDVNAQFVHKLITFFSL
jgi:hypothetical protein